MRRLFITICSVLLTATGLAQKTIKDVFMAMPDSIIPYINAAQRAELCKFSGAGDTLKIKSALNGEVFIDSISNTFARIMLNSATDLQLKLLPASDSAQIICAVKTLRKPVADSSIKFYTTGWSVINGTFGLPDRNDTEAMLDCLTARPDTMSNDRYDELRRKIEPVIVSIDIANSGSDFTYRLSLPLLNKKEQDEMKAIIKQKSFNWGGK